MNNLQTTIKNYLDFCQYQKRLDKKTLKAFFHYLEYKDMIEKNPFNKLQIKFREPTILPKTIPLHVIETFLSTMYAQKKLAVTPYQQKMVLLIPF